MDKLRVQIEDEVSFIDQEKFYTCNNEDSERLLETNKDFLQSEGVKHKGLRFNQGKLRYDLVNPWAHEQLVKVFTRGAEKYRN
jgi:hypothetical protein